MTLVKFTSAHNYQEVVFVNPDDVSVIQRYHVNGDLSMYSQITMRSGERVVVSGAPTHVAELIRTAKEH